MEATKWVCCSVLQCVVVCCSALQSSGLHIHMEAIQWRLSKKCIEIRDGDLENRRTSQRHACVSQRNEDMDATKLRHQHYTSKTGSSLMHAFAGWHDSFMCAVTCDMIHPCVSNRCSRRRAVFAGSFDDFNTLQHTASHCNTLQRTATHCNTLQHTATHCNTLQHSTTRTGSFLTHKFLVTHFDPWGSSWINKDTHTYIDWSRTDVTRSPLLSGLLGQS